MTFAARCSALFILLSCACVGSTLIGESFQGNLDGGSAGRGQAGEGGVDGGSDPGLGGADGGAVAELDATPDGLDSDAGILPKSIEIQPGPGVGEDVNLVDVRGQVRSIVRHPYDLAAEVTTYFNGVPVVARSLIRFPLPFPLAAANVQQAFLTLRHEPDRVAHIVGTRWLIGRAVGPWDFSTLSWQNQPPLSMNAFEPPPPSSPREDFRLEVTELVRDALAAGEAPSFLFRLRDEVQTGQRLLFCGSGHDDGQCRPALSISIVQPQQ